MDEEFKHFPLHTQKLMANMEEVVRLVDIHQEVTGTSRGRRHNVAILNKSGLVLMVSCWEAFVEDLASHSFKWLLGEAETPSVFPDRVLAVASKKLREAPDKRKVWALAGDGWRTVLSQHETSVLEQSIRRLNTPRTKQVDSLFSELLGFQRLSSAWKWRGMTNAKAKEALEELVTRRGEIAHRVTSSKPALKRDVENAADLVLKLSALSSNAVRQFLMTRAEDEPWIETAYRGVG